MSNDLINETLKDIDRQYDDYYTDRYWTKVRKTRKYWHNQWRETEYTNLDKLLNWLVPVFAISIAMQVMILIEVWELVDLITKLLS